MVEFRSGMQHLQDAIEAGKRRSESIERGGAGSSLNYFSWKDGDRKIIRFLADDMITGDFYDFIVNKDGKTSNFMVDPDAPERLKNYMAATPGIGWRRPYQSNTLEAPKSISRAVAVAVLRTEVQDPATGKLKVEDYLYDREIDGKMYPSRWFGIVQQGINNFWHTLAVSCFKRFGSIATMDYEITREGGSLDTKYSIIPLPEDPVLNNTEIVREFYFYGQPWDPNDEQRFLKCPKTTKEWAKDFSSEERHKRLLVGTGSTPAATTPPGGGLASASAQADEAQAMASSGTTFSSLTETLLNKARGS